MPPSSATAMHLISPLLEDVVRRGDRCCRGRTDRARPRGTRSAKVAATWVHQWACAPPPCTNTRPCRPATPHARKWMTAPSTAISPSPNGTASARRNHPGAFAWTGTASCMERSYSALLSVRVADSQRSVRFEWIRSVHGRTAVQVARPSSSTRARWACSASVPSLRPAARERRLPAPRAHRRARLRRRRPAQAVARPRPPDRRRARSRRRQPRGPSTSTSTTCVRTSPKARPGAPLALSIKVVDASKCSAIKDAAVDVWHCDAGGTYSGVQGSSGTTFLRGTQLTDANGTATFDTIYPGWYQGRAVHIHVKVHVSNDVVHTGQLFFEDSLSDQVFQNSPYNSKGTRDIRNEDDSIFSDAGGSSAIVPVTGSGGNYSGTITVGVKTSSTQA